MTAVDVDALDKLREAATHAHEPECCERCEAGERFHAGAVCAGAGCDPLVQCLRCGMPLPNHMPHDADCDAVLTITVPILAEVRRGRALREAVEGLAEEHQPVWAEDHFANERIRRDMCSCGESFHDACDVRIALDSLRAVLAALDPS